MAVVKELIRTENGNTLSFGDYTLSEKVKKSDYEMGGNSYKVKTYKDITRLERNDAFVYESVPGTAVYSLRADENSVEFEVEGAQDAQIIVGGEPETSYEIYINGKMTDEEKASLSGKVSFSVELEEGKRIAVKLVRR